MLGSIVSRYFQWKSKTENLYPKGQRQEVENTNLQEESVARLLLDSGGNSVINAVMFFKMLIYFQYLHDYIKSVLAPWVIGLLSIYNNLSLFFVEYLYFLNIRVIFGSRRFSLFLLRCVQAHVLKHWLTLECCVCKFHSVDQIKLQCKLIKKVILWNKRKN